MPTPPEWLMPILREFPIVTLVLAGIWLSGKLVERLLARTLVQAQAAQKQYETLVRLCLSRADSHIRDLRRLLKEASGCRFEKCEPTVCHFEKGEPSACRFVSNGALNCMYRPGNAGVESSDECK
jgi:hypothetical protein